MATNVVEDNYSCLMNTTRTEPAFILRYIDDIIDAPTFAEARDALFLVTFALAGWERDCAMWLNFAVSAYQARGVELLEESRSRNLVTLERDLADRAF